MYSAEYLIRKAYDESWLLNEGIQDRLDQNYTSPYPDTSEEDMVWRLGHILAGFMEDYERLKNG